jgi:predicted ester cyclase
LRLSAVPGSLDHVSAERNKARVLDLIERVMNGHDAAALGEFTSNPAVLGSGQGLLQAFPDLEVQVQWIVAEHDKVVVFHSMRGTQHGAWLFVQEPSGSVVETAFILAFRFDDNGQIIDQWLGSNFVEMLVQLGWGFAPVGQIAALPH